MSGRFGRGQPAKASGRRAVQPVSPRGGGRARGGRIAQLGVWPNEDEEEEEEDGEDDDEDGEDDDDDDEDGGDDEEEEEEGDDESEGSFGLDADGADLGTEIDDNFWDRGAGVAPKKRPRPAGSARRSNRAGRRGLLRRQVGGSSSGSLTGVGGGGGISSSRRSRRMKPLDATRELVVLMPGDDPIDKLGLEEHELPEFIICMEEDHHYDEVEVALGLGQGDGHGHGHGHGEAPVPEGGEVLVPEVTLAGDDGYAGAARAGGKGKHRAGTGAGTGAGAGAAFGFGLGAGAGAGGGGGEGGEGSYVLGRMGDSARGSTYSTYELDSDDESFLLSLKQGGAAKGAGKGSGAGAAVDPRVAALLSEEALEDMFSGLEREMHVCLSYAAGRRETEVARARCIDCLETSDRMLAVADASGLGNPAKCVEKLEKLVKEYDLRAALQQGAGASASASNQGSGAAAGPEPPPPRSPTPPRARTTPSLPATARHRRESESCRATARSSWLSSCQRPWPCPCWRGCWLLRWGRALALALALGLVLWLPSLRRLLSL